MDIFRYNDIQNRLEVTRQIQPSGCSLGKEEGNGTAEEQKGLQQYLQSFTSVIKSVWLMYTWEFIVHATFSCIVQKNKRKK